MVLDPLSIFSAVTGGLQFVLQAKKYLEDRKRRKQQEQQNAAAVGSTLICITEAASHYNNCTQLGIQGNVIQLYYLAMAPAYYEPAGSHLYYPWLVLLPVPASYSPNYCFPPNQSYHPQYHHSKSLPSSNGRSQPVPASYSAPDYSPSNQSYPQYHHSGSLQSSTHGYGVGDGGQYNNIFNGLGTVIDISQCPHPQPTDDCSPRASLDHVAASTSRNIPRMNHPHGYPPVPIHDCPALPPLPSVNHNDRLSQWLGQSYKINLAAPQNAPFTQRLSPRISINTGRCLHYHYDMPNAHLSLHNLFLHEAEHELQSMDTVAVVNWTKGDICFFEETREGVYYQNYTITQCDVWKFASRFKELQVFSGEVSEGKLQCSNKHIHMVETPNNGCLMGEWSWLGLLDVDNDTNDCILIKTLGGAVFGIIYSLFPTLSKVNVGVEFVPDLNPCWRVSVHPPNKNKTCEKMLFSVFSFSKNSWCREEIYLMDNVYMASS